MGVPLIPVELREYLLKELNEAKKLLLDWMTLGKRWELILTHGATRRDGTIGE